MNQVQNGFIETEWEKNIIFREPNDFLYAQRALKHKVAIHYKTMQNLFIEKSLSSLFSDPDKFSENIFEDIGENNSNNATNLSQLYSEVTYNRNITLDKYFYLDGKTTFDSGVFNDDKKNKGLKLLGRNFSNETVDVIGWMSRSVCDSDGNFNEPVRLIYEFKTDQSIVKWLIRSVSNEVPADFSVCAYDKNKKMIYKSQLYKNNINNRIELDINRGLCRYIELRITKWGIKDPNKDGGLIFKPTGAKIVYFFHHATFPKGITAYRNNDLLQSSNASEYFCSSIGKANYGVQSNTGQFTLININKLFDTLKTTGYLKNGLKVEYFVCVDKYYEPKVKGGFVDESKDPITHQYKIPPPKNLNDGIESSGEVAETDIVVDKDSSALSLEVDNDNWVLMATQYITDIEFDEVKSIVRFKTQDRMIKFKDSSYSGFKKVVSGKLMPIRNKDLIIDIMNRAKQKNDELNYTQIDDILEYEITPSALKALQKRTVNQGYLDEMSIWSALQKACDMDLIHAYINRKNVLIIDKNIQL